MDASILCQVEGHARLVGGGECPKAVILAPPIRKVPDPFFEGSARGRHQWIHGWILLLLSSRLSGRRCSPTRQEMAYGVSEANTLTEFQTPRIK